MKSTILAITVLSTTFFLSPDTHGQTKVEMEPVDANSTISDVTLYRNRAAITRTANLNLGTGGYTVFFSDLPSSAFIDSVQARVGENVVLLGVDTSSTPVAKNTSKLIRELTAQIEEVESKLNSANAHEEALTLQIAMLNTLITRANEHEGAVDLVALEEQLSFIGTKMTSLSEMQAKNKLEQSTLRDDLRTLRARKQNIMSDHRVQLTAVVDIGVEKAGTVQVQLTYLINNASWQPRYSIRANNAGDEITIEYDAELWQRTGENWTDVSMTLSTAQPQQSTTPPMPTPWFVTVYTPPSDTEASYSALPSTGRRLGIETRTAGMGGTEFVEDENTLSFAWASAATVNNDGPAVSFSLPRTITVPSNATDLQTTSLGAFETTAKLFRIAVPMLTDKTFIRSKVTNTSEYILLPGKASIFHGSDYVGKTTLPTIAPNETFPLDLGIDPVVTATRVLLEKETSSTGLFASGKQTLYEYQISISNGHDEAIEVHVWDRYPVSRNEEIEVTLKNMNTPLSTDPAYVSAEKPLGLLRWDLNIPANMTGDNSYVFDWQVEIARGKDVEMTPLPE